MQHVAWFVPQNWAIESFRMITVGDVGGMSFFWPLIVLAGFAVVFFSAGLVQLRHS
jgi:ABC-2 type transport system permease protein